MNEMTQENLDIVLDRQKRAWLDGSRPAVDELLKDSALPPNADTLLDLLYNEIVVREEIGETPSLDEYLRRYPHLQEDLKLHFEVHRAVHEELLVDTQRVQTSESLPDIEIPGGEVGPALTDYQIVGELGRGGMGVVYKARHRRLQRLVALKMFEPGRRPTPRELARFRAEAEAIARLQHPNIVQIFEVGQKRELPFLALELADKGTLAQKLQEMPFSPGAAAELIGTLACAVQHAHEQQIVHRDLKPANVLFARDGTPKITDFGLAKLLEAEPNHDSTRSGEPLGTPRYMAPEQAAGRPELIGPATDVYALGTMLYECMTGQAPFMSASVVETIDKIRHDQPVPPRRLQRSIPRDLETICLNSLHKEPGRRYASAQALADDLRRFLDGEPIHARRTPIWERAWMWGRRRPALATLMAASFVLLVAAPVTFGIDQHREKQRLAGLRSEIATLVTEGQQALARQDVQQAKEKFLAALSKIRAEPALSDHELGVRGWYDQSVRDGEQQRWRQRRPPPLFDELRDDAMVQSVLLDPRQPESLRAARNAIEAALALTVADEPSQLHERELLVLLDADLVLRQGDAAKALALLDSGKAISSRLWHQRRADCLDRLGRKPEADLERVHAAKLPDMDAVGFLLSGVDRCHQQDFAGAVKEFDKVMALEPDHLTARFFQAVCFVQLMKPTEAKIALTACIGQRPNFLWNYLFRGRAFVQMAEYASAAQDYQRALEMGPKGPARTYLDESLAALSQAVAALPATDRKAYWNENIRTEAGLKRLGDLLSFKKLARNPKN